MTAPRLWTEKLAELGPTLRGEADADPTRWAWRSMPRGAMVALYAGDMPDPVYGRRGAVWRIARKPAPTDEKGRKAWAKEVETFLAHLGIEGWQVDSADEPGVSAVFVSPPPPELPL